MENSECMKDVGKDHKMIVDRLASTLDGLRRTFDPAWDVMRDKETRPAQDANAEVLADSGSLSGIENLSPSQTRIRADAGWFKQSYHLSGLCCNFWGRLGVLYTCVLLIVLMADWYFFHHQRQKQSSLSRSTRGQPNNNTYSYSWTRTALKYAILCLVMIALLAGSLLYRLDAATIPHHLLRMM